MTPRALGFLLGAAALVAAASFALSREKKSEPSAPRIEEGAEQELDAPSAPEAPSVEEESSPMHQEPEAALSPAEVEEPFERELAEAIEEELKEPTVRERHLPVIRAIREDHPTPAARKEAMLEALRASGPTSDPWARRGREVFEKWETLMPKELELAPLRETAACYQAGCEITVRFPSQAAAEKGAEAFRQLQDQGALLHAGRVQTPAVEVGAGLYESSWIMLRPEGS